jgi:hypothetical protein
LAGPRGLEAFLQLELVPELEGLYLEALKAFARGQGPEPEKVLIQSEFAEPHRAYATSEDREESQTRILSMAIKELIKKELLESENSMKSESQLTIE